MNYETTMSGLAMVHDIIAHVDIVEASDWMETTREERYWMNMSRDLARELLVALSPTTRVQYSPATLAALQTFDADRFGGEP